MLSRYVWLFCCFVYLLYDIGSNSTHTHLEIYVDGWKLLYTSIRYMQTQNKRVVNLNKAHIRDPLLGKGTSLFQKRAQHLK